MKFLILSLNIEGQILALNTRSPVLAVNIGSPVLAVNNEGVDTRSKQ